jgi:hypothetical protein
MPMSSANKTYPERHRSYRDRLKARGMRQIVLWVPDTRRPGFADEIRRQLALVEESPEDQETLSFIEAAGDWSD